MTTRRTRDGAPRSCGRLTFMFALAGVVLVVGTAVACGSSSEDTGSGTPVGTTDQGSWYDRKLWPHDGDRIETANFVVFSDSAHIDARREVATVAEEAWAEVLDEFSVEPEMLRFPEGQTKIDLFAYRDPNLRDCIACADYGYLVIYSLDHPDQTTWARYYRAAMKHELVHVLHNLLTANQGRFDVWFIEGVAETVSGGTTGGPIRGLDQLEDLTSTYGRTSPIAFKRYFSEARIRTRCCKLNNAVLASARPRAYWTLVGFLAVFVGSMSWAVRRWTHRSRLAYLVTPLVLVATVLIVVAVQASFST